MKCIRIPQQQYEVHSYHTFEAYIKNNKFLGCETSYDSDLGGYIIFTPSGSCTMTPLKTMVILDPEVPIIETYLERDFSKYYRLVI